MGVFMKEWAALQGLPQQPTIMRVQTKAVPTDAPMSDPLLPSALLTARHAPRNASTQGLYEFLPASLLSNLHEEASNDDARKEEDALPASKESKGTPTAEAATAAAAPARYGSLLSRLFNRRWWRGQRGSQQQHRNRAALPSQTVATPQADTVRSRTSSTMYTAGTPLSGCLGGGRCSRGPPSAASRPCFARWCTSL